MDRSGANEDTYPMLVISRLITVTYLPICRSVSTVDQAVTLRCFESTRLPQSVLPASEPSSVFRRNHVADSIFSYLICMFQDSVPAGSYNDPFLSSVCDITHAYIYTYNYIYTLYLYVCVVNMHQHAISYNYTTCNAV